MNCASCGTLNPAHARFCVACASPFPVAAGPALARGRGTVLFADIVGSTGLVAALDAEDTGALLVGVNRLLADAVHAAGGSVLRESDGIAAVFGLPVPSEDHAWRACVAAVQMQQALAQWTATAATTGGKAVRVRIGISSGDVLLRAVSGQLHAGYSAEGATVHLAAKAEKAAPPGGALLTLDTLRLVRERVESRPHGALQLPGQPAGAAAEVALFELLALHGTGTRFQMVADRGLSQFVGRQRDLAWLEGLAEQVQAGHTRAAALVGEAGLGKSRLTWELRQRLHGRGWQIHAAGPNGHGVRSAYFTLLSWVRALYGLAPGDDTDRVIRKLEAITGAAEFDAAPLLALLKLPFDDARWRAAEPGDRRQRLRRSFGELIRLAAATRPTMLVVEDLHWADSETHDFLLWFIPRARPSRLLMVIEARPDPAVPIPELDGLEARALTPLDQTESSALFDALAGSDSRLAGLRDEIVSRSAGNPFFIEESIRMLAESGRLAGGPGAYLPAGDAEGRTLTRPDAGWDMPNSVADVLAARLAHLSRADRSALEMAAVLGAQIQLDWLQRIAAQPAAELAECLQRLVEAGLLLLDGERGQLRFRHAFTREATYNGMLRQTRRDAHARLLEVLDADGAPTELLAHHAQRAELWPRAVDYLHRAGRAAYEQWAMRESVRLLDEALRLLPHLPGLSRPDDWHIDLRLALRPPLVALGQVDRVSQELAEAETRAQAGDDLVRQCRVAVFVCGHHWFLGENEAAVSAGRRALELASERGDASMLVPVRQFLGGALHALGDHRQAQQILSVNVDTVAEDAPGTAFGMAGYPAVFCRGTRCWSHEQLGEFEAAERDATECMRIARASGHGFSIQGAGFTLGNLRLTRGEFGPAERVLRDTLAISTSERHGMWVPLLGPLLAIALARQGQLDEAAQVLQRTVPQPESPILTTYVRQSVVEALLLLRRLDDGRRLLRSTQRRAAIRRERNCEAELWRLQGEYVAAGGEGNDTLAEGQAALDTALDQALTLGMRPLQARCRLAMAQLALACGQPGTAQPHLDAAHQLFASLDLPYWVAQAERLRRPPDQNAPRA